MHTLRLVRRPIMFRPDAAMPKDDSGKKSVHHATPCTAHALESLPPKQERQAATASLLGGGEFFRNLSSKAISEFDSIAERACCCRAQVLIREGEAPVTTLFLLDGTAKLSINSIDGRRLIVGIAQPGEILGLSSAISGSLYEVTGEAQFPCVVASMERATFLAFLQKHPVACHNVTHQLSWEYKRIQQQVRTLALTRSAPAKLARLLLDWSTRDKRSTIGARVQCSFTHSEIGEHIGVSRETVTRCMLNFKDQGLVIQRGTILTISSRDALADYIDRDPIHDPDKPAA